MRTNNRFFLALTFSLSFLLVSSLTLLLMSCSHQNFVKSSYRVLSTSANVYDASMKTAADLYKQHLISESEKEKIVNIAKMYKDSFMLCNNAIAQYMMSETPENQKKAQEALNQMTKSLDDLIQEINKTKKYNNKKESKK